MEAPNNIYLFRNPIGVILGSWYLDSNAPFEKIEYARKDAFIEKACEWLKSNLYDYAGEDDKRNIVPFDDAIFEDFKKAMEE